MNISASKFSSGCESGWTVYLDQTYNISEAAEFHRDHQQQHNDNVTATATATSANEEEDLSMVSDASSGPPHYHYDYNGHEEIISHNASSSILAANYDNRSSATKNMGRAEKKKQKQKKNKKMMMIARDKDNKCINNSELLNHSCLDDTASSPISKNKSTFSRKEALMEYSHGFSATHFKDESAFGLPSQEPGEFQGGKWK